MKKRNITTLLLCGALAFSSVSPVLASNTKVLSQEQQSIVTMEPTEIPDSFAEHKQNAESLENTEIENLPVDTENTVSVGTTFKMNDITYRVTSDTEPFEVAAISISDISTELNLPATVAYEGVTYRVTSIPNGGFQYCYRLKKIVLPEGLRTVGSSAFRFCNGVKELHLPSTLETFCKEGFRSLETITLAEGNQAFRLIDGVLFSKDGTELRLYPSAKIGDSYNTPEGTTIIERGAFCYNQNLKSIVVSDDVVTINDHAFYEMQGLQTFTCGKNVSTFDLYNLYECPELQSVTLKGSYILGSYCINNCPKLERIEILDDIRGYGAYSFYDLPSLKEYVVNEGNLYYNTKDGVLYNGTDLLRYPAAKEGRTYVVPEGTTEIAALAFNYMQNTTEVILPPDVYVGTQAFNYPNMNSPIDIYFRDLNEVHLSNSFAGVFVDLVEGSKIYVENEQVLESFLSYKNAINPAGSVAVEIQSFDSHL